MFIMSLPFPRPVAITRFKSTVCPVIYSYLSKCYKHYAYNHFQDLIFGSPIYFLQSYPLHHEQLHTYICTHVRMHVFDKDDQK